jgi:phospholipid N-methyltransferase
MVESCGLSLSDTVVELGPGTGAFTRSILEGIGERTTFFALELDPIFSKVLRKRFPSLIVYNDSAENIPEYLAQHGKTNADSIISGLPWASLPMELQQRIMQSVLASLAPGGVFTTFGYVHARWLPNALRFRRRLGKHFSEVETSKVVWANFPPAFVYRCKR